MSFSHPSEDTKESGEHVGLELRGEIRGGCDTSGLISTEVPSSHSQESMWGHWGSKDAWGGALSKYSLIQETEQSRQRIIFQPWNPATQETKAGRL